jgi:two-component system response regulator FixJ
MTISRHLKPSALEQRPVVHVVDDDSAVRESLCWLLSSVAIDSRAYETADEFLAKWDARAPGCVLLDLRMPGTNGLELQQRLTEAGHTIPIIFLSGHGDVPTAVRALQNGAVEFLTKPFSERVLLERVNAAIERDGRQRRERREREVVIARYSVLTPREREVLHAVLLGKVNREIAETLSISPKTVELHRSNLMKKMHADSLQGLVTMCATIPDCQKLLGVSAA